MSQEESVTADTEKTEENEDECIQLSQAALDALNEYLAEKNEREQRLRLIEESASNSDLLDEVDLEENWQLSQFWYDDITSHTLASEVLRIVGDRGSVACISCPTLYKYLRKIKSAEITIKLLEFDTRFSIYGEDFILYDYRSPLEISKELSSSFDVVVADPPFLSEECLTKTALTMRYLSKGPLILCTGAIMEELAGRLLQLKMCSFRPGHKNNLANDFRCYANYDFDEQVKNIVA
nr:EOG090X0ABW [Eurycercus lamellatus]